jgi:hypothetical protein
VKKFSPAEIIVGLSIATKEFEYLIGTQVASLKVAFF